MKIKRLSILLTFILALSTFFSSFALAENVDKPNLVALGDSITYGWNIDGTNQNTPPSLKAFPNLIGGGAFDVTNISGGGWTSGQLFAEMNKPEKIAALSEADVITLDIGSNDLLQLPEVLALRANPPTNLTPEQIAELTNTIGAAVGKASESLAINLTMIIGSIKQVNPDALIIFYNLYNPFGANTGLLHTLGNKLITDINNGLYTPFAARFGLPLADAFDAINGKQSDLIFPYPDVHPNVAGQQALAAKADEILLSLIPEEITIDLTATPTEETTGPVTIAVTTSAEEVLEMKWLAGEKAVEDFGNVGTDVIANKFEVTENGTYTVYVLDGHGVEQVKTITISNIKTSEQPKENPDPTPTPTPTPTKPSTPPSSGTGHALPNTASAAYNYLAIGAGLLLAGFAAMKLQARRREN